MVLADGQFRVMYVAKDYAAEVAFYRDGLGLPVDHDWNFGPTDCGTVFKAGAGLLEVLGGLPGLTYAVPQGLWVSMQVEDVDAFYERAIAKGLKILETPTTYPWGQRILKIADPEGVVVWLFAPAAQS